MKINFPKSYVVFDFETTGIDPMTCEVVEIAAKKVVEGKDPETFETLVRFVGPMDPGAQATHGITKEMTDAEGKEPGVAFAELIAFAGSLPLVGHNIAGYDLKILHRHVSSLSGVHVDFVDTMGIFRGLMIGDSQRFNETHAEFFLRMSSLRVKSNLTLAATHFGVKLDGMTLHRAAADVEVCDQVYRRMCLAPEPQLRKFEKVSHVTSQTIAMSQNPEILQYEQDKLFSELSEAAARESLVITRETVPGDDSVRIRGEITVAMP